MKEEVLNYFKNDRSFETGQQLYVRYGNKTHFKKQLNMIDAPKLLTGILHEELRVLSGISLQDFKAIMKMPVVKKAVAYENITVHKEIVTPEQEKVTLPDDNVTKSAEKKNVKKPEQSSKKASGSGKSSRSSAK